MNVSVRFLDIKGRRCIDGSYCIFKRDISFDAECCCATDTAVCNCQDRHVQCKCCDDGKTLGGRTSQQPTVDLICLCKKNLYAVEITDRENLWKYKKDFKNKITNTRNTYKVNGVYIISSKMKSDRRLSYYFGLDVKVVRPGVNICRLE